MNVFKLSAQPRTVATHERLLNVHR